MLPRCIAPLPRSWPGGSSWRPGNMLLCQRQTWHFAQLGGPQGLEQTLKKEEESLQARWHLHSRKSAAVNPELYEGLSREVELLTASLQPTAAQEAQREELHQRVAKAAAWALDGCTTSLFGSAVTGLWAPSSDLDICLLAPGVNHRQEQDRALRKVGEELRRFGRSYELHPRLNAQVPLLRWAPKRPGQGLLACDISMNNVLAVANSRLLAQYVRVDPRVRTLGFCVKVWAKHRGINDRSRGTLSSFALMLMVIHFLQGRSVLPSLQDLAVALGEPPVFLQGFDCRYCSNMQEVEKVLKPSKAGAESVGFLLVEFFRHFGYEYQNGTIAIRSRASYAPREDEETCFLVIDNPFEPGKDVANVDVSLYTRLREEFRRAHAILSEGLSFQEACAPPPLPGQCPLAGPLVPGMNIPLRGSTGEEES